MSEQLTALEENRFVKLLAKAEEEYAPVGPPMSPLTTSFFTCWAFFDACVGLAEETIGTTTMAVGSAFGMHDELVRVIGLMQDSRMAIYAHEGFDGDRVLLRELVTNRVCKAISPSGYLGRRGELWFVRVLPPPAPGLEEHVVFTTPYLLIHPDEREWLAYFQRTLPDAPTVDRIAAYEHHMKFGPARDYWAEFVFEVDGPVATKQPKNYDQAVKILVDLRDLAARGMGGDFGPRIEALRQAQAKKPSFIERLRNAGL